MCRFAGIIDYGKVTHRSFLTINGYSYKFERLTGSVAIYTHTEARNNKSFIQTFYINTVDSHGYVVETGVSNITTVTDQSQLAVSSGTKLFLYYE